MSAAPSNEKSGMDETATTSSAEETKAIVQRFQWAVSSAAIICVLIFSDSPMKNTQKIFYEIRFSISDSSMRAIQR